MNSAAPNMHSFIALDHPRFRRAEHAIFLRRFVPDCMAHACALRTDGGREKLDACCQYGADTDLAERDAILRHAGEIRAALRADAAAAPWFTEPAERDDDFPSGWTVRTATLGDGCVFLAHDGRGCAIHLASLQSGFDLNGVKPHVCRLYPLTYDGDAIVLSDDFEDYSCADFAGGPSVYRVLRETLGAVFGAALVEAMDAAELKALPPRG